MYFQRNQVWNKFDYTGFKNTPYNTSFHLFNSLHQLLRESMQPLNVAWKSRNVSTILSKVRRKKLSTLSMMSSMRRMSRVTNVPSTVTDSARSSCWRSPMFGIARTTFFLAESNDLFTSSCIEFKLSRISLFLASFSVSVRGARMSLDKSSIRSVVLFTFFAKSSRMYSDCKRHRAITMHAPQFLSIY